MMAGLLDWFGKQRKRVGSRHVDRLALAVELLEPRHLLAADGLGFITGLGPSWHPDGPTDWHPAVVHSADCGSGRHAAQSREAEASAPELIYLDELAEQLGQVTELDSTEPWSCESDWYNTELF